MWAGCPLQHAGLRLPGSPRSEFPESCSEPARPVYPLVAEYIGQDDEQEAETEHNLARVGLAQLADLVDEGGVGAAVAMVTAGIKHHVKEEETEIFPALKAQLDRDELAELGASIAAAKK